MPMMMMMMMMLFSFGHVAKKMFYMAEYGLTDTNHLKIEAMHE